MKCRSDFVTNSSSNSYCVSLRVEPKNGNRFELNLFPDSDVFGNNSCSFELASKVKDVTDKIKACKTLDDLTELLIEESVCGSASGDFSWDTLSSLKSFSDTKRSETVRKLVESNTENTSNTGRALKTIEKVKAFRDRMHAFKKLDDIESVTVDEEFLGWGEFAYDTLEDFFKSAIPPDVDWETLSEDDLIELLRDHMEEEELMNAIAAFKGEIDGIDPQGFIWTSVRLSDGSVTKVCSLTA